MSQPHVRGPGLGSGSRTPSRRMLAVAALAGALSIASAHALGAAPPEPVGELDVVLAATDSADLNGDTARLSAILPAALLPGSAVEVAQGLPAGRSARPVQLFLGSAPLAPGLTLPKKPILPPDPTPLQRSQYLAALRRYQDQVAALQAEWAARLKPVLARWSQQAIRQIQGVPGLAPAGPRAQLGPALFRLGQPVASGTGRRLILIFADVSSAPLPPAGVYPALRGASVIVARTPARDVARYRVAASRWGRWFRSQGAGSISFLPRGSDGPEQLLRAAGVTR
jgi:hypothetical protein